MKAFPNRKMRVALLAGAAAAGLIQSAQAGDYYVDPNYAGVSGAPYLG